MTKTLRKTTMTRSMLKNKLNEKRYENNWSNNKKMELLCKFTTQGKKGNTSTN